MTSTIWRCAVCGQEYPYQDHPPKHGGPRHRALDRRYGFLVSCWRNKKCKTHNRKLTGIRVLLLSPEAPNPVQPEQDESAIQYGIKRRKR